MEEIDEERRKEITEYIKDVLEVTEVDWKLAAEAGRWHMNLVHQSNGNQYRATFKGLQEVTVKRTGNRYRGESAEVSEMLEKLLSDYLVNKSSQDENWT